MTIIVSISCLGDTQERRENKEKLILDLPWGDLYHQVQICRRLIILLYVLYRMFVAFRLSNSVRVFDGHCRFIRANVPGTEAKN